MERGIAYDWQTSRCSPYERKLQGFVPSERTNHISLLTSTTMVFFSFLNRLRTSKVYVNEATLPQAFALCGRIRLVDAKVGGSIMKTNKRCEKEQKPLINAGISSRHQQQ
ncbi:hypothetical protein Tcan_15366 [Toxocara canis]|uniref:Uncharacterized protein n=1 Tax=Toxocara canis TaxID=6265 RepID=A0A0B2UUU4_TOXCA|nr:hypothetical protein Tcan_15366 [Toxocara canis]